MAEIKVKKKQKTGGRKKGTPNKVSKTSKEFLAGQIDIYLQKGWWEKDFAEMEPEKRLEHFVKVLPFVMPRMSSTTVDVNSVDGKLTIEQELNELANDYE